MIKYIYKILLLVSILPTVVYAGVFDFMESPIFGDGNIKQKEQWVSTTSPINSITQTTYGKAIKISGLPDGCLGLTSGIVGSSGASCGSGSGGSGGDLNWQFFNNSGIKLATSSNTVLIGGTATTTNYGFEVQIASSFATSTNATTSLNLGIMSWGDSLTEGQGIGRFSYPNELQSRINRTVYNRGVGSENSTQIKDRFLAEPQNFGLPAIIWVGTNDRASANASTTIVSNINTIISNLSSTTRYLVLSVVTQSDEIAGSVINNNAIDINNTLASTYGERYLDVWQYLKDNNDGSVQDLADVANNVTPSSLRDDIIHMNERGYELVADYIMSHIKPLNLEEPDGAVINEYALTKSAAYPNSLGLLKPDTGYFKNIFINASSTVTNDPRNWQYLTIGNSAQPRVAGNLPAFNTFNPYAEGTVSTQEVPDTGFSGTNWTGSMSTGYTHTPGSTASLNSLITGSTTLATVHLVSFDISGRTAGSISTTLANNFGSIVDNPLTPFTFSTNQHYELAMFATSSSVVSFSPSSDFDGTISNIRVQRINRTTASIFTVNDSNGVPSFEMRVGSSTTFNMAIGKNAGLNLAPQTFKGVNSNVLVGRGSGSALTAGTGNVMLGNGTLQTAFNTNGNTGVGLNVLTAQITGQFNTGMGYLSLLTNTSGSYNNAFGPLSMSVNTTGARNNCFGFSCLVVNTTGSDNTAIGYYSLSSNISGSNNVSLGNYSGRYETGSDSFYIDNQDRTNISNQRSHSLLYGVFASTSASQSLNINASTTIKHNVTVLGTTTNDFSAATKNLFTNASTTNFSATSICFTGDTCRTTWGSSSGSGSVATSSIETSGYVPYWTSTGATPATLGSDSGMQYNASLDRLTITNASTTVVTFGPSSILSANDKVGIGTTTPNQKLDIYQGSIRFSVPLTPQTTPTATVGAAGALTGTYRYRVSYVTANGETELGAIPGTSVTPSAQRVDLTSIPISADASVTSRKIYRNKNADGVFAAYYLVTTITDNTTTTYTDNTADASLGAVSLAIPTVGGVFYKNTFPILVVNDTQTSSGYRALLNNVSQSNTAFGYRTAESNTTGGFNNAFGSLALFSNTSGGSNNAFGGSALFTNTSGSANSAFGASSLNLNTGSNNSAFGANSCLNQSTGAQNTCIGRDSGRNNQTGTNNTTLGYQAGNGVASNSYSNNTFLGYQAGTAVTTGSNNTCVGTSVCDALTSGNKNLSIGYNIDFPSNTNSNQLNIANIIFGSDIDGVGTTLSTGNIGIGSSSPYAKFAIQAKATSTNQDMILQVASSTNANLFSVDGSGHISTGGATPSVSSCGTSPSIDGNDTSGTVTVGSGVVTSCTITFVTPRKKTPTIGSCIANTAVACGVSAKSTTSVTFDFLSTVGSGTFDYLIIGQ